LDSSAMSLCFSVKVTFAVRNARVE
jgi:hypothetical protein